MRRNCRPKTKLDNLKQSFMSEQEFSQKIAEAVVKDVQFWAAVVGFIGVIVGAIVTAAGNILLLWYQNRRASKIDNVRKELLRDLLNNSNFQEGRSLETLSKVTGATHEECRRLLIEMKARGFTFADGREGWTYIKSRPIKEQ